ncbi:dihydroorotase [Thermococcus sp. M39]|uniref:dihydroorotase n=1 Tax=unclassified Thermococcus TaxID=2627626 RepID=UPI00143C769D|nr:MULTISPECIES: dihydroorotase [unclassified Thermococcus]NJE08228.1 dihydroorotase [Thermococcus sp. M39]NJE11721.1 dihydroorotase [Thermococcus sp. LS2]
MYELVLKGKFFIENQVVNGYIGVDNGKITKFSKSPLKGEEIIETKVHEVIMPGMIDVHVHLRDFNQKHKETVKSGTMAALHGGITTVFDMPNTDPPIMTKEIFEKREELFKKKSYADYALGILIAGNCEEVKKANADFYKIFMGASTGGIYSENFEEDYKCASKRVSVHAEDYELIQKFPERPNIVEVKAIEKALNASKKLKKSLHICHVSTKEGLKRILEESLLWISFEVTPHHLFLTKNDFEKNPLLKVYPPLRSKEDVRYLWQNFKKIPIVASDHAPHTLDEKEEGAAGLPGLETELALLLTAHNKGMVSLWDIIEKTSLNPAKIFGIKNKGFEVGKDADLIVVNLKEEWKVEPEEFYTKAKWSPFEGWKLKGKVKMTLLRGKVVIEDDEIVGKPRGERIVIES